MMKRDDQVAPGDADGRALWQRYSKEAKPAAEAAPSTELSERDLTDIAAFLDNSMDAWNRAELEKRAVASPALFEALAAAHGAARAPMLATEAPQAVKAFALNLVRPAAPAKPVAAAAPRGAVWRRFAQVPAWAWAMAMLVAAGTVGGGTYLVVRGFETDMADTKPAAKDPIAGELDKRGNSIFTDPDKVYFDGLDVEKR
jgi:hypothetical protein